MGVVVHIYNPSTLEAEAGGLCEFDPSMGYVARSYLKPHILNPPPPKKREMD
jgi:hypothetical protein